MKKTLLLAGIFGTLLFACKKETEENASNTNTVEAINDNFKALINCSQAAHDGDFSQMIKSLYNDDTPDNIDGYWMEDIAEILSDQHLDDYPFYENNEINFHQYTGIYTWDPMNYNFIKQESNSTFEVNFPGSPETTNNDFRITVENYSETQGRIDGEAIVLPKTLEVSLFEDNKEIIGITLNSLILDQSGNSTLPVGLNMVAFSAPFSHTVSLSRTDAKHYSVNYQLENQGGCVYALNLNASSNTSTYEEFDIETNLVHVNGNFDAQGLRYQFSFNAAAMNYDDPSTDDINRNIDVNILKNGEKIGELLWTDNEEIMLVSHDGSQHNFEEIVTPHLETIESIFSDFE